MGRGAGGTAGRGAAQPSAQVTRTRVRGTPATEAQHSGKMVRIYRQGATDAYSVAAYEIGERGTWARTGRPVQNFPDRAAATTWAEGYIGAAIAGVHAVTQVTRIPR